MFMSCCGVAAKHQWDAMRDAIQVMPLSVPTGVCFPWSTYLDSTGFYLIALLGLKLLFETVFLHPN